MNPHADTYTLNYGQNSSRSTRSRYGGNYSGRPLGVKNFQSRRYNEKQLDNIFGNMLGAVKKGVEVSLIDIARTLLDSVVKTEPQFNDYTGNLVNSYVAHVFRQRRYAITLRHDTEPRGTVIYGPRGGRRVKMIRPRHPVRRWQSKDVTGNIRGEWGGKNKTQSWESKALGHYRYLRKWEKDIGYGYRTYGGKGSYSAFGGAKYAQNWITIENQAPYAADVQMGRGRTSRHFNVLRGAFVRKRTSKMTTLVQNVLNQELKKAGFKIK